MVRVKKFIMVVLVRFASILIMPVLMGLIVGCSGEVSGPKLTVNSPGFPGNDTLEWTAPEAAGWSSDDLQEAHAFAQQSGASAVMALYDGKVFFSRGNIHINYLAHSIRMPFLNALYGIHVARGNLDLDATLADLNIDDLAPGLTNAEKQATVEHLLMSRSGVYHEAAAEDQVQMVTRPARGSHAPSTFFYYNNWDFNTLGTIFEQETGEEIFSAFEKEIADILEMVDFSADNCFYDYEWNKSLHPAYQFRMSVRDMAKFGALYQRNGYWKGAQVIGADWIDDSTVDYSTLPDSGGLGYGYLWKIIPQDSTIGQMIGYPGYYHSGADGYVLVVIPDLKLVIVQRYNQNYNWEDPEDDSFELTMLILDARLSG